MVARMQKHLEVRWLRSLFVVLSLMTSWQVHSDTWSFYVPFFPATTTYFFQEWGTGKVQTIVAPNSSAACNQFDPRFPSRSEYGDGYYQGFCGYSAEGYAVLWWLIAPNCPEHSSQLNPGDYKASCFCTPPYVADVLDLYKITSCVIKGLTITLSGGAEVEPSSGPDKKFLPIIATVKDQNGQPTTTPVSVHVSLKVDPKTGGHDHGDSTRPRGGIAEKETCASDSECWSNTTDGSGQVVFNFNAPEASGTHTISATCDGCSNTATKPVDVKVDGLEPIPTLPFYALNEANGDVIGARTGWHADNHNLTPTAAQKLLKIAVTYRFNPKFMVVADSNTGRKDLPPVLHINDASLPLGGVYDICARPDACPDLGVVDWKEPHAEHRRGTVVDVRANGGIGSVPVLKKTAFIRLLRNSKVPYLHESQGSSNEHFHLRLLGQPE